MIDNFLIRAAGAFQEQAFRDHSRDLAEYPARNPDQNVADIKAQIAANETGLNALNAIIARYGWETMVAAYMGHVKANAEFAIRNVIAKLADGSYEYRMDDGAHTERRPSRIDRVQKSATIDFTGTAVRRRKIISTPRPRSPPLPCSTPFAAWSAPISRSMKAV